MLKNTNRQISLVYIVTDPISFRLFSGQIKYMQQQGFVVHAVSSPGKLLNEFAASETVTPHTINMTRSITPIQDIAAVWKTWRMLRQISPKIIYAHTPKAGLIGIIGAWLARVPIRIYHVQGLRFEGEHGIRRILLRFTEYISCRLAHLVISNSDSVRTILINEKLCVPGKITILHNGSGNGVDATYLFNPAYHDGKRLELRATTNIPPSGFVIGYVGRLVRDKGITELMEAWKNLRGDYANAHLLIVGPFEKENPVSPEIEEFIHEDNHIHLIDSLISKEDMPDFYTAMDIVVLPSYREGFPNVLLEAGAMGLPVVSTRATGCVDAVADGVTGTLVPVGDADALESSLRLYLENSNLRRKHGQAGRDRVLQDFQPQDVWKALLQEFRQLLNEKGILAGLEVDV